MTSCKILSDELVALIDLHHQLDELLRSLTESASSEKLAQAQTLKKQIKDISDSFDQTINFEKETIYRELIGLEHYFGPDAIQATFGFFPKEVPPIPYTREQLIQAKKDGYRLILRVDTDNNGNALTMAHLCTIATGNKKLLYKTDWYQTEPFYTDQSVKLGWKLVGGSFLDYSTDRTFDEQRIFIRRDLINSKTITKAESDTYSDDYIDQIYRRTPVEIIYDEAMLLKITGKKGCLENKYVQSSVFLSEDDESVYTSVGVGLPDSVNSGIRGGGYGDGLFYLCTFDPYSSFNGPGVISLR